MSLSDVEIVAVVDEIQGALAGGSIGKVVDGGPETLVLEVGRERLLLAAHPRASRLHLATGKPDGKKPPSAFAMLLRKRLGGLRLVGLDVQAFGERVVVLDFGPGRDRLVAELSGPHANLILVDEAGAIVATLRPSGSQSRPLAPGAPYAAPPPPPEGVRWRGQSRFGEGAGTQARVAAHYAAVLVAEETAALRAQLDAALRRLITRAARREAALLADLARAEAAGAYKKLGDLLLAHLYEVPGRGATSVTLADDFEDGAPLTIALEPTLDGKANAQRYYKQGKRLSGGRKRIEERLATTRAAAATAGERLAALPDLPLAELARQLAALPAEVRGQKQAPPRRKRDDDAPALPYREFRSAAGDTILVGRSAADNDRLTMSIARGSDLWLHTRDAPGAHVVIRMGKTARGVSDATLFDAATLAAHFSPLAKEAQVDVTYTFVKHIRKPRGTAPGAVYLTESKTLRVRMDPVRLERLLVAPDTLTVDA